jgi:hypothetical protein
MVDVDSGKIIEFESHEIEELQRKIAADHGYELEEHSLVLYVRKKAQRTLLIPHHSPPDRLGHRPVAGITRVQVIFRVEGGRQPGRVGRIAQGGIEVDHVIERGLFAQPGIELFAQRVLVRAVVVVQRRTGQGAGERGEGGADDPYALACAGRSGPRSRLGAVRGSVAAGRGRRPCPAS